MTATSIAPNVAPPVDEVAPGLVTRVRAGDLTGTAKVFMVAGLVGLAATVLATVGVFGAATARQALFSYLVAYLFTLSFALGGLFFVLVQHITRAGWSVVVRRIAENLAGMLVRWMPLLFLPIAFGYDELWHHWTHAAGDEVVAGKSGYLNVPFFFVRAVLYFVVWALLARYFRGTSLKQDQTGDAALTLSMARRSAVGLLLFAITITFAAFDWVMTLDPHWYSTIFGVVYFAGSEMATLALMALLAMWLQRSGYLTNAITAEHYHDIGKLLFTFMVFWTYLAFSQYMLIWYANIPEETLWYQHRAHDSFGHGVTLPWGWVGTILVVGHFLFPFVFLMSRHMKRNKLTLSAGALLLLVMHWMEMQYLVMPNAGTEALTHGMALSVFDATAMVGVVGLFVGLVMRSTAQVPLLPERDPRLPESLGFHNI